MLYLDFSLISHFSTKFLRHLKGMSIWNFDIIRPQSVYITFRTLKKDNSFLGTYSALKSGWVPCQVMLWSDFSMNLTKSPDSDRES